ncbi:MAG: YgfZ/GcvT domain-containing protein [Candidatus Sulfotelmatobacter sp.]
MGFTALQAHSEGLGAAVADYRGAETASRFGDPQAEFAALHTSAGVSDLGYRAKISLTGADRVRWLNGMVTNNIRDLAADHGVYAFLLNPQGKILGDLYAYDRGDSITVDTDASQIEKILATFDHYIIMDDVEVRNLSSEITALGVTGPKARDILAGAGFTIVELEPLQLQAISWQNLDCTIVRNDVPHNDPQFAGYEIWVAPENVRQLWDALVAAGATPIGSEALELHRIVCGMPRYGVDIRERDLPQETDQARALNFNKGCYVGQEIVERIRSRGAVHRKFFGFVADAPITPGTKIIAAEKEMGEITSAAIVEAPSGDKTVALGYIRREAAAPGREVTIGAAKAIVASLPFSDAVLSREEAPLVQRPA